ncbi:MAG: redox-sensing transcriptional repressor Rex [Thermoanaerobaculales bacterium]|jgi:redox-sensing transcriptional repressor|nr:redox-sensing transcriptional repressor Rex [Thermoanaerobaculales bacterium]
MAAYKRHIDTDSISELTISRLSIYLRCVDQLLEAGLETVSSQELAKRFNLNSAQIRKDLAYFGEFGVRGVGYNVRELRQYIIEILGLDRERRLVIVGAGNLGLALCHYSGFSKGNFLVVGVLDSDPTRIGDATPAGLLVEDAERLPEIVTQRRVDIGVITTTPAAAQAVCDRMVQAGLRTVLNFAPTRVRAPEHVLAKTVDLKVHLEELSFFLAHAGG